jgi:ribosome maturation factor RimP
MPEKRNPIVEGAQAIAERIAASEGLELVEVEWKGSRSKGVLRIFIDKPGGVTHGDCETMAKQVSTILDIEDVIPAGDYQLEVSSPGLDRKLLKLDDYRRFEGKKANIRLHQPKDGRQRLTAVLGGVDDDWIVLETKPGEQVRLRHDEVKGARLVIEI